MKVTPDYTNRSVSRAFEILRCFEDARRPLSVTTVAEMTDLPLPTAFRFLRVLEHEGVLEQVESGSYRPSIALLRLGFATLDSMDIVRVAEPRLRTLANRIQETVNLGVLDRLELRYLIRIRNADLVTADIRVGSLLPSASTSMGKMLLAHLPEATLTAHIEHLDYETARGAHAIRTSEALMKELAVIRKRGWASQDEELEYGLRSIAVPVLDHRGDVTAAVNVAVPSSRWTVDLLAEKLLAELKECAGQISRDIGYVPPSLRLAGAVDDPASAQGESTLNRVKL